MTVKYIAKSAFAFGGRTYMLGDEFHSDGVVKMLVDDLVDKGLIAVQTTKTKAAPAPEPEPEPTEEADESDA